MSFKDYYQILGVSISANQEEIKKAYRQKARQYHPDKYSNSDITQSQKDFYVEKFMEVSEAYEILGDIRKRRQYNLDYEYNKNQQQEVTEDYYQEEKTSFKDNIKKAYEKVKSEETKKSFNKRHEKLNRKIAKEFTNDRETIAEEVAFRVGSGTVHVVYETFYQLNKLKLKKDDSLAKFIIRNRFFFTAILCSVILGNAYSNFQTATPKDLGSIINDENYKGENSTVNIEEANIYYPSYISLKRKYEVGAGDTLSQLAEDSGTSMSDIKKLNGLESDLLYYKDEIEVPYVIDKEDLQYYTMTIPTNGKSIQDLAVEYETDIDTLYKLNEEAITNVSDTYIIISDNILVPNFISKQELSEKKGNFKNNSW